MRVARERGISYKRLSGWEPEERIEYERDELGQVSAATVTREPEWDDAERAWAFALANYEDSLCPNCGRPLEVCTAMDTEQRLRVGEPIRCHFTTALANAREKYKDSPHPGALMWFPRLWEPSG